MQRLIVLKSKKFWAVATLLTVCAAFAYFITGVLLFPNEIKLLEGSERRLNFAFPIKATVKPEDCNVLQISQEPIQDNITIDFNHSVLIESGRTGTAQMTLSAFGFPVKEVMLDVLPNMEVIPCGITVGVRIHTEGVMVLGTGEVESVQGAQNPSGGVLKSGDIILNANGKELNSKEDLMEVVRNAQEAIQLTVRRNNEIIEPVVTPVQSVNSNEMKIGVWVRDSTQGIGTMTYYNPGTNHFGALGHGIQDIDTKQMMTIKQGEILKSEIVSVKKGKKGAPGELVGEIRSNQIIGYVEDNSPFGIYGTLDYSARRDIPNEKYRIALQDQVHEGPAVILSTVEGGKARKYDIFIETVNRYSNDDTRGMVIRITDPELLKKTNGIVQGMSGSPIVQDGNLIGAVTHVFVQDPTKGYGIFIENMLNHEK